MNPLIEWMWQSIWGQSLITLHRSYLVPPIHRSFGLNFKMNFREGNPKLAVNDYYWGRNTFIFFGYSHFCLFINFGGIDDYIFLIDLNKLLLIPDTTPLCWLYMISKYLFPLHGLFFLFLIVYYNFGWAQISNFNEANGLTIFLWVVFCVCCLRNIFKAHYMHLWTYHNETSYTGKCLLIKK
jgi:hypothetical protein